ncbi:hypothetical protein B0H11DRAFT_1953821 [Mycena galericulata]|nr:hypothetical protein B0H11DRAFT_1953821 [Mycena galericulata]
MSADIALALALEIKELILNVPRNKEKLHELNKRCISLLSSLKDPSIDAEDDSSAEFLAEMELVLRGIRGRLKRRKASNYLIAFLQQGEMESWIGAQNQRIEDAFRTMNTRFLIAHASKLTENRARQERDHDEIRRYITDLHTKFRSHFNTEQSSGFDSVGEALSFILHPESLSLPHSTQQASDRPHQQAPHLPPILAPSRFSFEDFLPSPHQISPSDSEASGSQGLPPIFAPSGFSLEEFPLLRPQASNSEASGSRRLLPILAPFDPRSFSLEDFPPSPPHTSPSDSEASRSRRLPPILTPSGLQLEDFPPSPPQISPSDSEASGSRHLPSILAPSRFSLEDFSPSPPQISSSYSESSWSLIERATTSSTQPICKFSKGKISCGNLEGLIDYLIATDDLDSTGVMLDTYMDFATPGEVFEIVKRKVHGVLQELGHDQKYKIIKLVLAWVQTVPDSSVLQTVKDWALAVESGVTGDHQKMILRAIVGQSRRPILPTKIVSPAAPVKPQDLAIALTFIESDFQRPIRLLDYLLYSKGLPSRFEALISHHEKLIRWVKRSIMRHDEIQDRAYWIKRLVKTTEIAKLQLNVRHCVSIELEIKAGIGASPDDGNASERYSNVA